MKKAIKVVSLDCSTKCSGVAVWENGLYIASHIIDCSDIKDTDERIRKMGKQLWEDLDYCSPSIVFIEDTYCHGNPDVQKKLDRIQGIVLAWCIQHDAIFEYVLPSTWRKYIDGFPNGKGVKRQEQKNFSVKYVTEKYGITPKSDDESDAILIGEAAINMYK